MTSHEITLDAMIDVTIDAMIEPQHDRRASGRTTRMIKHAVQLAAEGKAVNVLMLNVKQCQIWESHVAAIAVTLLGGPSLGIRFETEESLGLFAIDWPNVRLRNTHPNCILLIDHAVIEHKFSGLLSMWQRYDRPYTRQGDRLLGKLRNKGVNARPERLIDGSPARERADDNVFR